LITSGLFLNILNFWIAENNIIIAEIYRGEGELLKVENIFLKPVLNNYRQLLRKAGGEIVNNQILSDETKAELNKPLIPYDQYVKEANKSWDENLRKTAG